MGRASATRRAQRAGNYPPRNDHSLRPTAPGSPYKYNRYMRRHPELIEQEQAKTAAPIVEAAVQQNDTADQPD